MNHHPQRQLNMDDIRLMSDKVIVEAIIARDAQVTKLFFYEKCYPLFKSVFDKYESDCKDCIEFINEMYVHIMVRSPKTGLSKLEGFGFNCTLTNWLKIVTENFCHQVYKKKKRMPIDEKPDGGDSLDRITDSIGLDLRLLDISDVEKLLAMMPNERYRLLIRYRYVDGRSNEETAGLLNMNMDNYYNKHRLAKKQFRQILRKEKLI